MFLLTLFYQKKSFYLQGNLIKYENTCNLNIKITLDDINLDQKVVLTLSLLRIIH